MHLSASFVSHVAKRGGPVIPTFSNIFSKKFISERLRGRRMPIIYFLRVQKFFEIFFNFFKLFFQGVQAELTEGPQCQKLIFQGSENVQNCLTGQKVNFFKVRNNVLSRKRKYHNNISSALKTFLDHLQPLWDNRKNWMCDS